MINFRRADLLSASEMETLIMSKKASPSACIAEQRTYSMLTWPIYHFTFLPINEEIRRDVR